LALSDYITPTDGGQTAKIPSPCLRSVGVRVVIVTWEDLRSLQANNFDIFANQMPPGVSLGMAAPEPAPASDLRVRLLSSNPWSAEARLALDLPEGARVEANVYGMQGRWLRSLAAAELTAGTHELRWDGRNAAGMPEPAGVYFLRVEAGHRSHVIKLLLAR
jgi:FlgD Ig-like domain